MIAYQIPGADIENDICIYIYIWKKIMDCNPTICEEKLQ